MESDDSLPMAALLTRRLKEGGDAAQIADQAVATWEAVDAALSPIIGRQGVAALYRRSVYICLEAHPWLAPTSATIQTLIEYPEMKAVLAGQNSASGAAGAAAVMEAFHELLTGMVGRSLTDQLLGSVWATSFTAAPAQDSSP